MYGPGSRGLFAPNSDFMSFSLLVLGVASFLFHGSLRHTMQFADEIGMLGLAWSMLQGTLTVRQSPARTRIITTCLVIFFPLFAIFYVWSGKVIYHSTAFFIMLVALILRTHHLLHWLKPEFPEAKRLRWRVMGSKALVTLLAGYALWQIDLEFCAPLRALREWVGLPWAWLFELHGWWHILTAMAASQFMDIFREMREELISEKDK